MEVEVVVLVVSSDCLISHCLISHCDFVFLFCCTTTGTVDDLSTQLEEERMEFQDKITSLEKRIAFFSETQEHIDVKNNAMQQQKKIIEVLKKRLYNLEQVTMGTNNSPSRTPARGTPKRGTPKGEVHQSREGSHEKGRGGRSLRDIKKIKELQGQLQDMAEAMRKRNPNSGMHERMDGTTQELF